jgi:hypothetical protein
VRDNLQAWNGVANPAEDPPAAGIPVHTAVATELYIAFEGLGAPPMLLAVLSEWGDEGDLEQLRHQLELFNATGSTFDHIDKRADD